MTNGTEDSRHRHVVTLHVCKLGKTSVIYVFDRQTEQELREKVKELESEVKSLKTKLDDLRKAKNTTLIKREKEFVSTGIPHTASNESSTQNANLKEKEDMKAKYEKEIEQVNQTSFLSMLSLYALEGPLHCTNVDIGVIPSLGK